MNQQLETPAASGPGRRRGGVANDDGVGPAHRRRRDGQRLPLDALAVMPVEVGHWIQLIRDVALSVTL